MTNTLERRLSALEKRMPRRVTSDLLFGRVAEMMRLASMTPDQAFQYVVAQVGTEDLRRIREELRTRTVIERVGSAEPSSSGNRLVK